MMQLESVPYPLRLWTSVAGALIGSFQFGYQVGVLNTALPFIRKDIRYHRDGVLSSAVVLGAAAGALTAGTLADRLGPRHAQVFNCLAFLLGSVLTASSTARHAFLVGRFISGIGAGSASLYVPRYIAEVSPPCLRGRLGSMNQVVINAGILVAYCAGIPYERGFVGFDMLGGLWVSWWRVMVLVAIAPAVLQVLVLAACPESPVWLESVGRRDAADEACISLWGPHALLADPDYEADAARAADLVTLASEQLMRQSPAAAAVAAAVAAGQGLTSPLLLHPGGRGGGGGGSSGQRSTAFSGAASTGFSGASPAINPGSGSWAGGAGAGGSPLGPARRPEASRLLDGGFGGRSSVGFSSSGAGPGGGSGSEARGGGADGCGRGVLEGWDGLLGRQYRWMMALAVGLPLLQQASGINTVVFYSSKVFADAGLSSPIAASIITGCVNLAFTVAAAGALDKYGRKPLLLLSYSGMAVSLAAVAGVTLLPASAGSGLALAALLLVYVAFFAAGSGPVTWVVLSEVLPPRIKGPAASLATAAAWAGNLLVTASFDGLLRAAGLGGAYLLYGLANMCAALWVAQLVVETRCRTLPEIEALLLLPDRDPRLTALLPALQAANSRRSSSGALDGGSPPPPGAAAAAAGGGGAGLRTASGSNRSPLGARVSPAVNLLLQQQQYAQYQQQQQQLMMHRGPLQQQHHLFAPAPAGYASFGLGSTAAAAARLPGAAVAALSGPYYAASNGANSDSALAANVESALLSGPEPDLLLSGGGAVADELLATRQEFVQGWAEGAAAAAAADAAADAAAAAAAASAAGGRGKAARVSQYGDEIAGLMSPPDAASADRWRQQQHDDEDLELLGSELPESVAASSQADGAMSCDGPAQPAAAARRGSAAAAGSADEGAVVPGAAAAAAAAGAAGGRARVAAAAPAAGFPVVHGFAEPPRAQQQQQQQQQPGQQS